MSRYTHLRVTTLTKTIALIIVLAILATIGIIVAVNASHGHKHSVQSQSTSTPAAAVTEQPVNVRQPPTAKSVADSIECTDFKDLGPAQMGGVLDSGTCMIGMDKFAIDTFETPKIRDTWMQAAMQLGVRPWRETSQAVIYPSDS